MKNVKEILARTHNAASVSLDQEEHPWISCELLWVDGWWALIGMDMDSVRGKTQESESNNSKQRTSPLEPLPFLFIFSRAFSMHVPHHPDLAIFLIFIGLESSCGKSMSSYWIRTDNEPSAGDWIELSTWYFSRGSLIVNHLRSRWQGECDSHQDKTWMPTSKKWIRDWSSMLRNPAERVTRDGLLSPFFFVALIGIMLL